ncbi:MAG: DEAD/DEAH box helicase [Acidobacteria bacterium]|nr:DEAD/DEAH box helicase [Acidobacteriota bacterium]
MTNEHTPSRVARQRPRRRRSGPRPAGAAPQTARPQAPRAPRPQPTPPVATIPAQATSPVQAGIDIPSFSELSVPAPLVKVLHGMGAEQPFPIQVATLRDSLSGRDVLGRGKTGSGKTIAFAVPLVARLSSVRRVPGRPTGLVLVPTRELARQVAEVIRPLANAMQLKVTTVFGGVGQGPQVTALRNGVDILVACPGRLEDLIQQRHCSLDAVQVTVIDEADHMADLGFLPAVRRLLDVTPKVGQRLLFSATLDNAVDTLVRRYLNDPVVHSVDAAAEAPAQMHHHMLMVSAADKPAVVRRLAGGSQRAVLFTRTKHGAKKLAKVLTTAGTPSVELHGNLAQGARDRNLELFRTGKATVLVATDIAARGIHVDEVALVVHVDPPAEHKAYLHRSGRTARAGTEGTVVTIVTPEQADDARKLAKAAGIQPQVTKVTPSHELLGTLAPGR